MDNILLNDNFVEFVNLQMQENLYILNKIEEYKKYNSQYSKINEIIEKQPKTVEKLFLQKMVNCYDIISLYENAFAYYLGMQQTANMKKLENS